MSRNKTSDNEDNAESLLAKNKQNEADAECNSDVYNRRVLIPFKDYEMYKEMKAKQIPNQYEHKIEDLKKERDATDNINDNIRIMDEINHYESLLQKNYTQANEKGTNYELEENISTAVHKNKIRELREQIKAVAKNKNLSSEAKSLKIKKLLEAIKNLEFQEENRKDTKQFITPEGGISTESHIA